MAKDNSSRRDSRNSQRGRILRLLIQARGGWVSLTEILALGIAQYNARLFELRGLGFRIENRRRQHCSEFRLVPGPAASAPEPKQCSINLPDTAEGDWLFPDDAPPRHLDLG